MKGENFTRTGLSLFAVGLIIFILWAILYDHENDVVIDGKIAPQNGTSKGLMTAGFVFTSIGYVLCIAGFAIASDFLNFSLKMPKNNLIET